MSPQHPGQLLVRFHQSGTKIASTGIFPCMGEALTIFSQVDADEVLLVQNYSNEALASFLLTSRLVEVRKL